MSESDYTLQKKKIEFLAGLLAEAEALETPSVRLPDTKVVDYVGKLTQKAMDQEVGSISIATLSSAIVAHLPKVGVTVRVPFVVATRACQYASIISLSERINALLHCGELDLVDYDLADRIAAYDTIRDMVIELMPLLGLDRAAMDSIQTEFTEAEVSQHEEVFSFWSEESDLTEHVRAVTTLYRSFNHEYANARIQRALAALAILRRRESLSGN